MNRRPLKARKPLKPISDKKLAKLATQGVLNPTSTFTPRKPVMTATKRRQDTGPKKSVIEIVDERSGRICEWPGCGQPQTERHHRLNRKNGGRHGEASERVNGAAWLLGACRPHHAYVTSPFGVRRERAIAMGWLLLEHQDAAHEPVHTRHSDQPVYLAADGSWATFEEVGT